MTERQQQDELLVKLYQLVDKQEHKMVVASLQLALMVDKILVDNGIPSTTINAYLLLKGTAETIKDMPKKELPKDM